METMAEPVKDIALISKYEVTVESIATAVETADALIVTGPEDKAGMKMARSYRLGMVKMRTTIEARRKELKVEPLDYLRKIDETAKELTEPLPPAEARLKVLEETSTREKERLETIEREKRSATIRWRCKLMNSIGALLPIDELQEMTTEEFDEKYADLKQSGEARLKKEAEALAAQKAERVRLHRLAEEQAEKVLKFECREAEQAERQKAIDAAEQKIRAELLTMRGSELSAVGATVDADLLASLTNEEFSDLLVRKTSELEEKKESATQARRERIAQEEVSRIGREAEAVGAETKRKADALARAPDREKIVAFHNAIAGILVPQLSPAAQHKQHRVEKLVNALLTSIDVIAGELS